MHFKRIVSHQKYSSAWLKIAPIGGVLPHGTIINTIGGTIYYICDVKAFLNLPLDCQRIV